MGKNIDKIGSVRLDPEPIGLSYRFRNYFLFICIFYDILLKIIRLGAVFRYVSRNSYYERNIQL